MGKYLRVCGVDASTSSTGVCFACCEFADKFGEELTDLLINDEPKTSPEVLREFFKVEYEVELKTDKWLDTKLKTVRKHQRDAVKSKEQTRIEDTHLEEYWQAGRTHIMVGRIIDLIDSKNPDLIIVEDYSYHSKGSTTQLAELKGALKYGLIEEGFFQEEAPYFFVAPVTSVKKIGSTKGNANKEVMCRYMQRYGFFGYEDRDDQLDAIAIALSVFYAFFYRLFGLKFPDPQNAKERNKHKSWKESLEKVANRFGNVEDMKGLLYEHRR